MAIDKEITFLDGSTPRYARIIKVTYDFAPPKHYADDGVEVLASVEVGIYQTEEARRSGFVPTYRHVFHLAVGPEVKDVNLPALYGHIEREDLIEQLFTTETGITKPVQGVPADPVPPLPPFPLETTGQAASDS